MKQNPFNSEVEILKHYQENATLSSVLSLLSWDQEALMPKGGIRLRSDQIALLSKLNHERMTDSNFVQSVTESISDNPHIKKLKLYVAKERSLSPDFVNKSTRAGIECVETWKQARQNSDFKLIEPHLKKLVEFGREKIELWRKDPLLKKEFSELNDYEVLLGEFDPGLKSSTIRQLLNSLTLGLRERIPIILEKQKARTQERKESLKIQSMPRNEQNAMVLQVIKDLGFNFNHGRIDESVHPFCGGSEDDVRMTTRYKEGDFTDALSSCIHECGHALYNQGLPLETLRTPCGGTDSFSIHESQSRLYENMLGRSQAFCEYLSKLCSKSTEQLCTLLNWVEPSPIRVDADEVTYNLHILLRMELEEALIQGNLEVKDLPEAWNSRFKELLGFTPTNDREGCLQDIHWYSGSFGYFPSYSMGNLLSADLFSEFTNENPDWQKSASEGDFSQLLSFLRTRVHSQASFDDTPTRIRKMLKGRDLNASAFFNYIDSKYLK